jgi:hypothetical protein
MRRRFNRGRYYERTLSGELKAVPRRDSTPVRTKANEPAGTHSQEVSYLDAANEEVARVHQYIRVGGVVGASGLPDPKRILENGILYRIRKQPQTLAERILFKLSDLRDRIWWMVGIEIDL